MAEEKEFLLRKEIWLDGAVNEVVQKTVERSEPGAEDARRIPHGAKGKPRPGFNRAELFKAALEWADESNELVEYLQLINVFPNRKGQTTQKPQLLEARLNTKQLGAILKLIDQCKHIKPKRKIGVCVQEVIVAFLYMKRDDYYLTSLDFLDIRLSDEKETLLLEPPSDTQFHWALILDTLRDRNLRHSQEKSDHTDPSGVPSA